MKARLDFVSNSSSSSFIIACDDASSRKTLKAIAESCTNPNDKYHDKTLLERNFRILDFCTNTYQLLFLGQLKVGTEKFEYVLGKKDRFLKHKNVMEPQSFNAYLKELKSIEDGTASEWLAERHGKDVKVDDTHYIHYEDIFASQIVVPNHTMESDFYHYHFTSSKKDEDCDEDVKRRVEALFSAAKYTATNKYSLDPRHSYVEVYSITLDTITNTQNLIDVGHTVKFDAWENINDFEKCLKSGNSIFYIREAHSGDGYGDFHIFCEDGAIGVSGVDGITIIGGESL